MTNEQLIEVLQTALKGLEQGYATAEETNDALAVIRAAIVALSVTP